MSLTTFAGSAQFAVVSVLGAGGTAAAAIAAAVLLNARYGPMAPVGGERLPRRLAAPRCSRRSCWSTRAGRSSQRDGRFDRRLMLGAGLVLYVGWSGGTAIGVVAGDSLGDPATLGLDAAFPALFLALLAPLVAQPQRARGGAARRRHRARAHAGHSRGHAGDRGHRRLPRRPAPAGERAARTTARGPRLSAAWTAVLVVGLRRSRSRRPGPCSPAGASCPEQRRRGRPAGARPAGGPGGDQAFASDEALVLDERGAGLAGRRGRRSRCGLRCWWSSWWPR